MDKILLIGSSGREHAIARALKRRKGVELYSIMARRNPGIAALSKEILVGTETDMDTIMNWGPVKTGAIDMAFIGPEAPLAHGFTDALEDRGINVFGPSQLAARVESSKSFLRNLMAKHKIPGNISYATFTDADELKVYKSYLDGEFVVKPVGLTGGKGVRVMGDHFQTKEEGINYAVEVIEKKIGGDNGVVIEEKLVGEEFTLQVFTDGKDIVPMPLVQDHKRLMDGDQGPNTGGMGSYSCADHMLPFMTVEAYDEAIEILDHIVKAMAAEGSQYKGVLYGQFMMTKDGPKIIETNCRFGDPEAINVLSLLENDLVDIAYHVVAEDLRNIDISFAKQASVVKYIVPSGYGLGNPKKDVPIDINTEELNKMGVEIYYASVGERDGNIYTSTSRALSLLAKGNDVPQLAEKLNRAAEFIQGPVFYRKDIGSQEMIDRKIKRMKDLMNEK